MKLQEYLDSIIHQEIQQDFAQAADFIEQHPLLSRITLMYNDYKNTPISLHLAFRNLDATLEMAKSVRTTSATGIRFVQLYNDLFAEKQTALSTDIYNHYINHMCTEPTPSESIESPFVKNSNSDDSIDVVIE